MTRHYITALILCGLINILQLELIPVHADSKLTFAAVEDASFDKVEEFDAVIEALHQSTVSSRIAAEVIELNYDVNDVVPKGAVIMKFRDEEFQARVAQIEASLMSDKAQNKEAIARRKEAAAEAERVKSLFKRKLLAQAGLDKAIADLSAANAKVQAIQAQIKSRQAQLQEAKVQLSYTQIIAPYSGVVTERFIELGEMASPGQHLMTGVSLQDLRAVVAIPQYLLPQIMTAQHPVLTLTDGRQINGGKMTVIPSADVKSHSIKVRVDLPADITFLYPGMYSKLKFVVGQETIRVIPQAAIAQRSEVSGVYVQLDNKPLQLRQIRLGRHLPDGQREVLAGLSVGDKVALDPLQAAQTLKLNSSEPSL
jgi:RND family efflux transporter MFP subunit